MLRALRIKLYPNATQVEYLARLFGCCRKIYNLALDESERLHKETGKGMTSRGDLINYMHRVLLKNPELSYLHEHNTKIMKGMMKNHNLAKSLSEVNLGECRRLLEYKASWYGRTLSVIDRWYPSSKTCSVCGYRYDGLTLDERSWTCPECGTVHDRDVNAARNILAEGLRIIGGRSAESTPVETQPTRGGETPGAPCRGSRKKRHGATI